MTLHVYFWDKWTILSYNHRQRKVNSALHLSEVAQSSTVPTPAGVKAGKSLLLSISCDPTWHVISYSSKVIHTKQLFLLSLLIYFTYYHYSSVMYIVHFHAAKNTPRHTEAQRRLHIKTEPDTDWASCVTLCEAHTASARACCSSINDCHWSSVPSACHIITVAHNSYNTTTISSFASSMTVSRLSFRIRWRVILQTVGSYQTEPTTT